jgi:nucleoside-diphosphate-sugar epimerase
LGIEEVYALAADMGEWVFISSHHAQILHNNILISTHTLDAARENGVRRYLYTSSACVYPEYRQVDTNVGATSRGTRVPRCTTRRIWMGEADYGAALRTLPGDYGMETRTVRFHNIFGPLGTWDGGREKAPAAMCRKVALAKLTGDPEVEIWGDGEQTRSFCYIDDCVAGIFRLMRSRLPPAAESRPGPPDFDQWTRGPRGERGGHLDRQENMCQALRGARTKLRQLHAAEGSRLGAANIAGGGAGSNLYVD